MRPAGRGARARAARVETVVHGETGFLVDEPSAEAFADAIGRAAACRFDTVAIRHHAERFGRERFGDEMEALVQVVSC